jgi:ribosome-binding factor A
MCLFNIFQVSLTESMERANIFWALSHGGSGQDPAAEIIASKLNDIIPSARAHLASKIRLKAVPELSFSYGNVPYE